jgi:hypothetical protein
MLWLSQISRSSHRTRDPLWPGRGMDFVSSAFKEKAVRYWATIVVVFKAVQGCDWNDLWRSLSQMDIR